MCRHTRLLVHAGLHSGGLHHHARTFLRNGVLRLLCLRNDDQALLLWKLFVGSGLNTNDLVGNDLKSNLSCRLLSIGKLLTLQSNRNKLTLLLVAGCMNAERGCKQKGRE